MPVKIAVAALARPEIMPLRFCFFRCSAVMWPISWPSTAARSASFWKYGRMPREM